ncbi:MAG TPA: transketolase C-terminal domain-containing protein, partial [Acidobacteriota bacterium]
PCDGNQTAQLVAAMADCKGISFLRTTREKTPVLYSPDEKFTIGGSKIVRQSASDRVAVVAAGITVHEAIKACDELQKEGIPVRLIDAYSVKPIDARTLRNAVQATEGRLVVSEDHWPEGGLGSAVLDALTAGNENQTANLRMIRLAVKDMPGSGTPQQLLDAAGISAKHIAEAVRKLMK